MIAVYWKGLKAGWKPSMLAITGRRSFRAA